MRRLAMVLVTLALFMHNSVGLSLGADKTEGSLPTDGSRERVEGFALIAPGSFRMGSPQDEAERRSMEGPQHEVRITRRFLMKTTPVSQREWQALMGNNPSRFSGCPDCPVEQVNWWEAVAYCNALSRQAKLPECYTLEECSGKAGEGMTCRQVRVNAPQGNPLGCEGYRLPTEAEWEYATRAGTTGARYGDMDAIAWHIGNAGSKTHATGQKQANAWGLHDMLGNISEWVWDWYGYYSAEAVTDPLGPGEGTYRVYRGGSWLHDAKGCRAAFRDRLDPGYYLLHLGFRIARSRP